LSLKGASKGEGRREYINCPWPRFLSDVGLYWHTGTKTMSIFKEEERKLSKTKKHTKMKLF